MAVSKEDILDTISNMSVMDVVDLISAMEEKFGVSAAAPVAVAAGPAAFGRLHLVQHGRRLRPIARVARPRCRSSRCVSHGGHEAHALGHHRGGLELEVRAGQLQRELPPAVRPPADPVVDERAS